MRRSGYVFARQGWATRVRSEGWDAEAVASTRCGQWIRAEEEWFGTGPLGFGRYDITWQRSLDIRRHNLLVSFAYVAALAARRRDRLKILDWGGDVGSYRRVWGRRTPGCAGRVTTALNSQ